MLAKKSDDPLAAIVGSTSPRSTATPPARAVSVASGRGRARGESGPIRRPSRQASTALMDILMRCCRAARRRLQRQQALAMMAQVMVGAMVLARAVDDAKLFKEILSAAAA